MISTNRGETEISGPGFEVITDLQIIVRSVKRAFERQGMPPEFVNKCIERAVDDAIR